MGLRSLLSPVSRQEKRAQSAQRKSLHARAELERRKQREREKCKCAHTSPPARKASSAAKSKSTPKAAPKKAAPKKAAAPRKAARPVSRKRVTLSGARRGVQVRAAVPKAAPARVVPLADAQRGAAALTARLGTWTGPQLAAQLGIPEAEISPVLARLQASGKIRRYGSGFTSN